jgi:oxygen-independent coproporphyrinogen-3 oxidase
VLTPEQRALEAVMLGLRLREGLELSSLSDAGVRAAEEEVARRRVEIADGRVQLTLRGRLFADAVARELSV